MTGDKDKNGEPLTGDLDQSIDHWLVSKEETCQEVKVQTVKKFCLICGEAREVPADQRELLAQTPGLCHICNMRQCVEYTINNLQAYISKVNPTVRQNGQIKQQNRELAKSNHDQQQNITALLGQLAALKEQAANATAAVIGSVAEAYPGELVATRQEVESLKQYIRSKGIEVPGDKDRRGRNIQVL